MLIQQGAENKKQHGKILMCIGCSISEHLFIICLMRLAETVPVAFC